MAIPTVRRADATPAGRTGVADRERTHPGRTGVWGLVALAGVTGLAAFSLLTGPAPIAAPWDVFILLDGAYRIIEGQISSTDFASPIGLLVYAMTSLGMRLQPVPSLAAATYGNLIFLGAAATMAWVVARRRLPGMYAAGFTVFVALLVVSVRPLGFSPWVTTYAMLYNRYGWALFAILLVLLLVQPRPGTSTAAALDGVVLGVLLGLMFYCKINFFLAGLFAVAAGCVLRTPRHRILAVLVALLAFGAVLVGMWLGFGVRVSDYVHDLAVTALVQDENYRIGKLVLALGYTLPVGVLALGVIAGLFRSARRRGEPTRELWRLVLLVISVLGLTAAVSAVNTPERYELPALVTVALLIVGHHHYRSAPLARASLLGVGALVLIAAGPIVGKDAMGLGKAVSLRGEEVHPQESQRMHSDHLRDFVIPADATWSTAYRMASDVPSMINDGIALLGRHISPGDQVFTVALTNPFSFAMSLPPGRGEPLWWDLNINFNRTSHPDPTVLDGARWVMVPTTPLGEGCCQATVAAMLELYGPHLAEHYTEVERTADWILLMRSR